MPGSASSSGQLNVPSGWTHQQQQFSLQLQADAYIARRTVIPPQPAPQPQQAQQPAASDADAFFRTKASTWGQFQQPHPADAAVGGATGPAAAAATPTHRLPLNHSSTHHSSRDSGRRGEGGVGSTRTMRIRPRPSSLSSRRPRALRPCLRQRHTLPLGVRPTTLRYRPSSYLPMQPPLPTPLASNGLPLSKTRSPRNSPRNARTSSTSK